MTQHTVGPWSYEREHRDAFSLDDGHYTEPVEFTTVTMGDGNEYQGPDRAEVYGPAQEANARLIAAAPELLEALKEAERLAELAEQMTGCRSDDQYVWAVQKKISAAIFKATGGDT